MVFCNDSRPLSAPLQRSAYNTSKELAIGLASQFAIYAQQILNQMFPISSVPQGTTGGNTIRESRSSEYGIWMTKINLLVDALKAKLSLAGGEGAGSCYLFETAQFQISQSQVPLVPGNPQTTGAALWAALVGTPAMSPIRQLLSAFVRVSDGFYHGDNAELQDGQTRTVAALNAASLSNEANNFIETLGTQAQTQAALQAYMTLRGEQDRDDRRAQIQAALIHIALVEVPIMVATTVLTSGTMTAAVTALRITSGIRNDPPISTS